MLKNYLIVAIRNFWKSKTFSFINVLGLALGMTCSLIIMLWVFDEKRVDNFHKNSSRLYVMYEEQYYDGKKEAGYMTPGRLYEEIKKVIPEIECASGLAWNDKSTFT